MQTMAADLHAWLSQVPAAACPGNLSDILAQINMVIEPTLQAQRVRNRYIESGLRAIELLSERLQPIAQVFARIPGFDGTLSLEPGSIILEPADGRQVVWEAWRGWKALQTEPYRQMLWSGICLRLYEGGRSPLDGELRLIAEHALRSGDAWPCVVWRGERLVPAGSAQQELAIAELVNELTENLRFALHNYRILLQIGAPGYPTNFPRPLP